MIFAPHAAIPSVVDSETLSLSPATGAALLDWYDAHRRRLPWRAQPGERPDPYRVWLSEIMLQQTTVAAVKPYFAAFLARWPTVEALAAADDDAVMAAWAGLGYYARARNLLACARALTERGGFPQTAAALSALPGVGAYTSAAIAAIAFGERAVVVDGNVERVVARLTALATPPKAQRKRVAGAVEAMLPDGRYGDFAQATMDLGATICTPKTPVCALCPLSRWCKAAARGDPLAFPVKPPRKVRAVWEGVAFVPIRPDGTVLVRRRPAHGLLGGMAEVFGSPWGPPADGAGTGAKAGARDGGASVPASADGMAHAPFAADWALAGHVEHGFTHAALTLHVMSANVPADTAPPAGSRWAVAREAGLPTLMRKVVERAGAY